MELFKNEVVKQLDAFKACNGDAVVADVLNQLNQKHSNIELCNTGTLCGSIVMRPLSGMPFSINYEAVPYESTATHPKSAGEVTDSVLRQLDDLISYHCWLALTGSYLSKVGAHDFQLPEFVAFKKSGLFRRTKFKFLYTNEACVVRYNEASKRYSTYIKLYCIAICSSPVGGIDRREAQQLSYELTTTLLTSIFDRLCDRYKSVCLYWPTADMCTQKHKQQVMLPGVLLKMLQCEQPRTEVLHITDVQVTSLHPLEVAFMWGSDAAALARTTPSNSFDMSYWAHKPFSFTDTLTYSLSCSLLDMSSSYNQYETAGDVCYVPTNSLTASVGLKISSSTRCFPENTVTRSDGSSYYIWQLPMLKKTMCGKLERTLSISKGYERVKLGDRLDVIFVPPGLHLPLPCCYCHVAAVDCVIASCGHAVYCSSHCTIGSYCTACHTCITASIPLIFTA